MKMNPEGLRLTLSRRYKLLPARMPHIRYSSLGRQRWRRLSPAALLSILVYVQKGDKERKRFYYKVDLAPY